MKEEMRESKEHLRSHSSYIIGIVAIVLSVFNPLPGVVLGIIGLVQSSRQKNDVSVKAKKYNIIAIILGLVFIAVSVILSLSGLTSLTGVGSA